MDREKRRLFEASIRTIRREAESAERELEKKNSIEARRSGDMEKIGLEKLCIQTAGVKVDSETTSIGVTDDLDSWLTRFERFAAMSQRPTEKWASSLRAFLTGRALDCYRRLLKAHGLILMM
ncbi:hypothetical protein PoB_004964700 [Plakobranchus ocellatus]|uniref:Uncharacterized protein n=1 Tax=Plakobranchus ocellatus TaxID=259542 RepID=A0AAV4BUY3_9GAST|nr:hypothetical protein PoB_004964700 [Plakobranchus ocellatus]